MNLGPVTPGPDSGGRYDPEATRVRDQTGAAMVLVVVVAGDRGTGFSVQAIDPVLLTTLPTLLRNVADNIERQRPPHA
jgi:hypothetical protein